MSEQDPVMRLTTSNGEFEARRNNSVLFRFMGRLAMYDHAFFTTDEDAGKGFYVFALNPQFETIANYMLENKYEAHINLQEVAECDLRAYDSMLARMVENYFKNGVPDSWA